MTHKITEAEARDLCKHYDNNLAHMRHYVESAVSWNYHHAAYQIEITGTNGMSVRMDCRPTDEGIRILRRMGYCPIERAQGSL